LRLSPGDGPVEERDGDRRPSLVLGSRSFSACPYIAVHDQCRPQGARSDDNGGCDGDSASGSTRGAPEAADSGPHGRTAAQGRNGFESNGGKVPNAIDTNMLKNVSPERAKKAMSAGESLIKSAEYDQLVKSFPHGKASEKMRVQSGGHPRQSA
jgi:hypothetical protein